MERMPDDESDSVSVGGYSGHSFSTASLSKLQDDEDLSLDAESVDEEDDKVRPGFPTSPFCEHGEQESVGGLSSQALSNCDVSDLGSEFDDLGTIAASQIPEGFSAHDCTHGTAPALPSSTHHLPAP